MASKELENIISPAFNEEVLNKILSKASGFTNIEVKEVEIGDSVTNKGDSYLSSIVRFSLTGINKDNNDEEINCNVFVKYIPKNISRRKTFRSHDFFKNEVAFYNDIWEVLSKFQDTKILKNPFINIPICYAALTDGENDFIALEDLNTKNFSSFRRQGALSYESVILIIRLFARFHALSFAFKDQYPQDFERIASCLEETYFSHNHKSWYIDFNKSLIAISRDAVQKELPEKYLNKFEELISKDLYNQMCAISENVKGRFSLITQGDAWVPNFLCKYDSNNQPAEIKMIDFQLSRCTSPVCDITFFLYACTSYELLTEHWDDILTKYHAIFCNYLVELGSSPDIFPFDDFKEDFKTNGLYGLGMAMEALPFQMMDDSDTPDLDAMKGEEAVSIATIWRVHPIKTPEGRQRLANVIKHAVDNGFI